MQAKHPENPKNHSPRKERVVKTKNTTLKKKNCTLLF
jgi:hypothetical protein